MRALFASFLLVVAIGGCNSKAESQPPAGPVAEDYRVVFPHDSKQLSSIASVAVEPEAGRGVLVPGRVTWDETRTSRVFSPVAGRIVGLKVQPSDAVCTKS